MKIINLKAENVQRLKAVDITPGDESLVVVGGNNGQGKTSLLDSIMFALGGKSALSQKPVRDGERSARVEITVEGYNIARVIRDSGKSELEVRRADGGNESSPQKLLDSLTSKLTFDPLAFAGMEPKQQVEVIKSLIPFDFSGNETLRKNYYDERTYINRELKAKTAENEANPFDPTVPVDPQPIDLSEIKTLGEKRNARTALEATIKRGKEKCVALNDEVKRLEARRNEILAEAKAILAWLKANEPKLAEFGDIENQMFQAEQGLSSLESVNLRITKNAEAKKIFAEKQALEQKSNDLTAKIEKLDADKMCAIQGATLPIGGLAFDEDGGVLFRGIPFGQLSGAERLKVSLAMGIALNPSLRILLIRDGSLLDDENLSVVAEMAARHDMQVWIERVGKGEECSIIIEDGMVAEDRTTHADANQQG